MARQKKYVLPYGEGSFYQRESDGMWVGSIEAGTNASGKRRRITVTSKDKEKAWNKLQAKRKDIAISGMTPEGVRAGASVESWLRVWLQERQKTVRPKTFAGEAAALNKWVIPVLGRRKLDTLSPADMRKLTDAMEDAGMSSTYAGKAQMIFQQALKAAILEGHSVPERALLAKRPTKAVSDRQAIPLDDAVKLLHAARHARQPARWVAALLQGMRQGEVLGLTWECVDLESGTLDISWQLQDLRYADRDKGTFAVPRGYEARQIWKGYHLVRPKSASGYRVIPLVPWMRAQLQQMKEEAESIGAYSPHAFVFPREGGLPQSGKVDREEWKALQDAAGIRKGEGYYVLHEARHTAATLLLAAGVDPEIIKAIMGHSDIVTTRGYQHVNVSMLKAALEKVAEQLQIGSR